MKVKKIQLLELLKKSVQNEDWDNYINVLFQLINEYPSCLDDYYLDCNILINHNFLKEAKILLDYLIQQDVTKSKKIHSRFLTNKIREREEYNQKSDEEKEIYNTILEKGSLSYHSDDLDKANNYYRAGLDITNDIIFHYYLGKIYYKKRKYKKAIKHLELYIQNGSEKYQKASLYLIKIFEKTRRETKLNRLAGQAKELSIYEETPLKPYFYFKERYDSSYDLKPYSKIKKIQMTEEDFKKRPN